MNKKATRTNPTWSDVKSKLKTFDESGLLGIIQSLYSGNKDNKAFLHARLGLGENPLIPYKQTISRWINPDLFKNQDISVSKAKKAVSDYKKALGDAMGMAELSVFYCEEVFHFLDDCGMDDEGYYFALIRMFGQALKWIAELPKDQAVPLLSRMEEVRKAGQHVGYGVDSDLNWLWEEAGLVPE